MIPLLLIMYSPSTKTDSHDQPVSPAQIEQSLATLEPSMRTAETISGHCPYRGSAGTPLFPNTHPNSYDWQAVCSVDYILVNFRDCQLSAQAFGSETRISRFNGSDVTFLFHDD